MTSAPVCFIKESAFGRKARSFTKTPVIERAPWLRAPRRTSKFESTKIQQLPPVGVRSVEQVPDVTPHKDA